MDGKEIFEEEMVGEDMIGRRDGQRRYGWRIDVR